ncbi:MAG: Uma2 family endonuclease [bacterium]
MPNLMTAEELFEMGNSQRCELIKGEYIAMSPSGGTHGRLTNKMGRIIGNFIEEKNLGEGFGAETGFILSRNPDTVRAPDFAFIAKERLTLIDEFDQFLSIAPDLAVEVVSPGDLWTKIEKKIKDFLHAGVRLIWVINRSNKTIHVYHGFSDVRVLTESDHLTGEDVLPGFSIPVKRIFE